MEETERLCRGCGLVRPIGTFARVKSNAYNTKFTWCRKRTCNACVYQRRKNRR